MTWILRIALLEATLWPSAAENLGCYHYGFAFTNPLTNVSGNPFQKLSAYECQMQCKNTVGCSNFGFYPVSGSCYLGHGGVLYAAKGAVAGPKECPVLNKACTELPDASFPADTPPQTMQAWPGGVQPTPLQCWPRRSDGLLSRCRNQTAIVLEDTQDGWPGQCDGMVKITNLKGGETCQTRCMLTPLCSVWAIESTTDRYGATTCWHGMLGYNCSYNPTGMRPIRAQRLQHGTYRVLMNSAGVQLLGLHNSFRGTVFKNWEEGAKHCKLECRSFLLCQFWQYSRTYGCFLEMPQRSEVGYPLTTTGPFASVNKNSQAAQDIVAGEMLQHNCIGEMSAIPTAAPSAEETRLVVPGISPGTRAPKGTVRLSGWGWRSEGNAACATDKERGGDCGPAVARTPKLMAIPQRRSDMSSLPALCRTSTCPRCPFILVSTCQATKIPTALAMDELQICIQKHIDRHVEVATSNGRACCWCVAAYHLSQARLRGPAVLHTTQL
eukprot:s1160_g14.t1